MTQTNTPPESNDFARRADEKGGGIFGELWNFLRHNKKWWMTPIILVLLLLGVLVILAGTGVVPLIYTLF